MRKTWASMRTPVAVASVLVAALGWVVASTGRAFADPSPPAIAMTPAPSTGYHDGEKIDISAPANSYFKFGNLINVIECGDPGGTRANLPHDYTVCDGATIQPLTVAVQRDGSFALKDFVVFKLPSTTTLEESPDTLPKCDATHACVLYIGENQLDFTQAHVFSAPFWVGRTAAGPGTSSTGMGIGIAVAVVLVAFGIFRLGRGRRHPMPPARPVERKRPVSVA